MAGDWMKIDKDLPEKPEVWQMAQILDVCADEVVGRLIRVWRWFDSHTEDGVIHGVTEALVDSTSGVTGFATAMISCGWLELDGGTMSLPNFDRHNSKTAKKRALTAKRVADHKARTNAKGNASLTQGALPREEKRREEKNKGAAKTPPDGLPDWLPEQVWADWHDYRNSRKGWTKKAKQLSLSTLKTLRDQGHDPKAVVEQSIERGWSGLFPIKSAGQTQQPKPRQRKEL